MTSSIGGLLTYLAVTFTATWSAWLLAARLAGGSLGNFGATGGPIFLLGVFAPGLVAIAFAARADGADGARRLLSRIGRWHVDGRWYAFAVGYLIAIKLTAATIHRLATGTWPAFGTGAWLLIPLAITASTLVQAGEEVGWRGHLLPRLAHHTGLAWASVLVGIAWALWHLPLFYLPGSGSQGHSFPLYLLGVTALSVAMTWLYWRTDGSLLLVMLMHASVNNTTGIVPTSLPEGATSPWTLAGTTTAWLTVGLAWLVAAFLLPRLRRADVETLSGVS